MLGKQWSLSITSSIDDVVDVILEKRSERCFSRSSWTPSMTVSSGRWKKKKNERVTVPNKLDTKAMPESPTLCYNIHEGQLV